MTSTIILGIGLGDADVVELILANYLALPLARVHQPCIGIVTVGSHTSPSIQFCPTNPLQILGTGIEWLRFCVGWW